jgi:hypothetical protein
MGIANFSSYFDNTEDFDNFKIFSKNFIAKCEILHNGLIKQGYSESHANHVVYRKMYHTFFQAKNHYDKLKRQE